MFPSVKETFFAILRGLLKFYCKIVHSHRAQAVDYGTGLLRRNLDFSDPGGL